MRDLRSWRNATASDTAQRQRVKREALACERAMASRHEAHRDPTSTCNLRCGCELSGALSVPARDERVRGDMSRCSDNALSWSHKFAEHVHNNSLVVPELSSCDYCPASEYGPLHRSCHSSGPRLLGCAHAHANQQQCGAKECAINAILHRQSAQRRRTFDCFR
jgi:hypothetical protein